VVGRAVPELERRERVPEVVEPCERKTRRADGRGERVGVEVVGLDRVLPVERPPSVCPVGKQRRSGRSRAGAVLLNGVAAQRAGTASGVFNTSRQLGGALAVAVFGALLANPASFLSGVRLSLLLAAAVALLAAAVSLLLRPGQA
jgi:hypothetical protein